METHRLTWLQRNLKGDPILWAIVILFSLISIAVVYSATGTLAYRNELHGRTGSVELIVLKHSSLIFIGLGLMWLAHRIDYRHYSRLSLYALLISVPLLLFTYFMGGEVNGASRWLTIPVINQTFQPSDLAKLALISHLASMLSRRQQHLHDFWSTLFPVMLWVGVICGLIVLSNASTALLLFLTCLLLMFIGRVPMKQMLVMVAIGVVLGGAGLWAGERLGTVMSRVTNFTDKSKKPQFQLEHSFIAIATGGLTGKGPGKSTERNIMPHPYSDFIYAIIIEEYGMIGGLFVLFLYLAFLYRGLKTVMNSQGAFGGLLSAGLSFSLVLQAMVNMGVAVGLGPVTGLPLPMLSMGGTSLIFTGLSVGVILAVSRGERETRPMAGQPADTVRIPSKRPPTANQPLTTKTMKFIISGGGTGGHIFPAVAIANEIRRRQPDAEILFVGANGRMEMTRVPEAGYQIVGLDITGLQRRLTPQNILFPVRVFRSVRKAGKLIQEFRPDAVVGVGGYASAPVLLAATSRGIPSLIQEQNSYAGLVNKLLGRRVNRICVAYDGMEKFFPADKVVLTGNPVRTEIAHGSRAEALAFFNLDPTKKTLLVIGGSLGARTLNLATAAALSRLRDAGVQLLWQTGKIYFPEAQQQAAPYAADHLQALEFIRRMDLAYAAADVVISRAGALSVSELCLTAKASVLVPSPNVAEDHQTKNALALVGKGAAVLITDEHATTRLYDEALRLLTDPARQQQLGQRVRELARPDATKAIVDELFKLLNK